MKEYFKNLYPLVVIALAVGGILGGTYMLIEPSLTSAADKELQLSLSKALPEASIFTATNIGDATIYIGHNTAGSNIGYVFKGSNSGYGGPVETLIGITNGAVDQLLVLSLKNETPGLGSKAGDKAFLLQFSGLSNSQIPAQKSDFAVNSLDALSGATLTSLAVALNIREAFQLYQTITDVQTNTNLANRTPSGIK